MSGGRDQSDGDRVTARGAGEGRGLDRRTLEVALRHARGKAQLGEEVVEGVHSQYSLRYKDGTRNVFFVSY